MAKLGTPIYARKFLMTPVMDKSEEEIMAAIKFYYNHGDPGAIIPYTQDETSQSNPLFPKPPLLQ